jgi:hypothetical protein
LHLDDTQIQDLRDEIEAKDEALREARQQYETLQETYQEAAATLEAKTREFEELTARLEAAGWTDYTRDKEAETGRYRELLCRREQLQVRQYRERAVYHVQLWPLDDESARGARVPSTLQREHGAFLAEGGPPAHFMMTTGNSMEDKKDVVQEDKKDVVQEDKKESCRI